jgi:hypothetical protein
VLRGWLADCFALDVRSLALFRVALALLVLGDLAVRAADLKAFYTDAGIVPRSRLADGSWSLHALDGSEAFQATLFVAHAAAAVALLVGYWTRLATFLTCFLLVSLHARNPHVLQGGDALLRILLFWGLFLPLGACFALDARRAAASPPRRVASVAAAALVLQIAFVYWFSAAIKTDPCWHEDGTAVYYVLSIDQLVKPAGRLLLGYPALMRWLTHATWWFEVVGPALLFVPVARWQVRTAVVAAFLAFHLVGLNLCLELGPFPYVCAAAWLALLPGPLWDRLGRRWARGLAASAAAAQTPWGVNLVAGLFLAYVFLWNLRSTDFARFEALLPRQLNGLGSTFGLDQFWTMFAPGPPRDDGWYVCVASLEDGEQVDPLREGRPVTWEKPELVSRLYANERWRKFLMNLCREGQDDNRVGLLNYLWREWDAAHSPGGRMVRLELYYMHEETPPPGGVVEPRALLLGYRRPAPALDSPFPEAVNLE